MQKPNYQRMLEQLIASIPEGEAPRLLLHSCCAPCSSYCLEFYSAVKGLEDMPEGGERCFVCYRLRLEKAAQYASEHGFDYFCSTLSISPMKNAAKLNEIGEELSEIYPVKLLPSDFKKKGGYLRSIELSREYGLYRQNYCGCVFSKQEAERRESGKKNPENPQN